MAATEDLGKLPRTAGSMPGTVIAVLAMVGLVTLFDLNQLIQAFLVSPESVGSASVPLLIAVLLLIGLWRGQALAWQWGIYMPVLAALGTVLALGGALGHPILAAVLVLLLLAEISIPILLTLSPSRRHFGLECPRCHSLKSSAGDFLFTRYRCKRCNVIWNY